LTADLGFEWDPNKAAGNLERHRVSFEEAATVFDDPMFITLVDEDHSIDEERYITIGLSNRGRVLLLAHTDRKGQIRIISAREATRKEKQYYAEAE
jgi:uncharacterized DUF497 family protein